MYLVETLVDGAKMARSGHAFSPTFRTNTTNVMVRFFNPPRRAWVRRGKSLTHKVKVMAWTSPVFEEVVLCCEINSYVSAQL
jgi:hypothetical protein